MLHSSQRWILVPGELEMHQSAWRDPDLIVARTRSRGISTMELASAAPSRVPRTWMWIVLRGELHARTERAELVVRAGEALVSQHAHQLGTSAGIDMLRVVLPAGLARAVASEHAHLDRTALARAKDLATRLDAGDPRVQRGAGGRSLRALLETLSLSALDRDAVLERARREPSPEDRAVGRLVARLSSELAAFPGVDDAARELALPERRASEVLGAYFRRYHVGFDGWRTYLSVLRAELAYGALESRRVRPRELARSLGFRGAPALYHALERRGLALARR